MTRSRTYPCSLPLVITLCLLTGVQASANPLDEAKKTLNQAQRDLNHAKETLDRAVDHYKQAIAEVNRCRGELDKKVAAVSVTDGIFGSAHYSLAVAQEAAKRSSNELARVRMDLTMKHKAVATAESLVNRLLASDIVLYDLSWRVLIDYNALTRSFNAWAELPNGLKITSSAIANAFHGDIPLPEIDPAELLAAAFGFQLDRQCTFDDEVAKIYRNAGPDASVYVSSRGLAELCSPEHAEDEAVKAVISSGSTVEGALDEVSSGWLNELNAAYAFLRQSAPDQSDKLISNLMDAMVTGTALELPNIQIKPFKAEMKYTVRLTNGARKLAKFIPGLQKKIDNLGFTYSYIRPGFAIVVKNQTIPTRDALLSKIGTIKPISPKALKSALGESYQLLEPALMAGRVDPMAQITVSLERLLRKSIYNSDKREDPVYANCLDLRGTPVHKELERLASKLKIGRLGEANFSRLSYNFQTGQVSIVIDLRAKDVTNLGAALKVADKTVDDLSDNSVLVWKATLADIEKLRQHADSTVKTLASDSKVVERRMAEMLAAQEKITSALKDRDEAKKLVDAALSVEKQRDLDVRDAKKALAQAESHLKGLEKLIQQLSRYFPQSSLVTRPHPYAHSTLR